MLQNICPLFMKIQMGRGVSFRHRGLTSSFIKFFWLMTFLLFPGCFLATQQLASVSQGGFTLTSVHAATLNCRSKLLAHPVTKFPDTGLASPTTDPITPGRAATRIPVLKSLFVLNLEKGKRGKRGSSSFWRSQATRSWPPGRWMKSSPAPACSRRVWSSWECWQATHLLLELCEMGIFVEHALRFGLLGFRRLHDQGRSEDEWSRLLQLLLAAVEFGHQRSADRPDIFSCSFVKWASVKNMLCGVVFLGFDHRSAALMANTKSLFLTENEHILPNTCSQAPQATAHSHLTLAKKLLVFIDHSYMFGRSQLRMSDCLWCLWACVWEHVFVFTRAPRRSGKG